jgi:hypothetical protein
MAAAAIAPTATVAPRLLQRIIVLTMNGETADAPPPLLGLPDVERKDRQER